MSEPSRDELTERNLASLRRYLKQAEEQGAAQPRKAFLLLDGVYLRTLSRIQGPGDIDRARIAQEMGEALYETPLKRLVSDRLADVPHEK